MNTPKRNTTYEKQLQQALNELHRRSLSYDPARDALAQEARRIAKLEGQAAAKDTAARLSSQTGGYANSYAVTAATGAYLASLQDLQERLPSLVTLAKSVYDSRTKTLTDRIAALQKASEQAYRTWRDAVADAQKEEKARAEAAPEEALQPLLQAIRQNDSVTANRLLQQFFVKEEPQAPQKQKLRPSQMLLLK